MKAKMGPEAGITATAHKIAIIFYTLVTKQVRPTTTPYLGRRDRQRQQDSSKSSNAKHAASDTNSCLFNLRECSLEAVCLGASQDVKELYIVAIRRIK